MNISLTYNVTRMCVYLATLGLTLTFVSSLSHKVEYKNCIEKIDPCNTLTIQSELESINRHPPWL